MPLGGSASSGHEARLRGATTGAAGFGGQQYTLSETARLQSGLEDQAQKFVSPIASNIARLDSLQAHRATVRACAAALRARSKQLPSTCHTRKLCVWTAEKGGKVPEKAAKGIAGSGVGRVEAKVSAGYGRKSSRYGHRLRSAPVSDVSVHGTPLVALQQRRRLSKRPGPPPICAPSPPCAPVCTSRLRSGPEVLGSCSECRSACKHGELGTRFRSGSGRRLAEDTGVRFMRRGGILSGNGSAGLYFS